jgi:predicted transcriptional regulator of viral defense system
MNADITKLFKSSGGFLKAADIYASGVTIRQVQSMIERGEITRIKRGYYQIADMDEPNEAAMMATLFPEAILCMDTALFHYGYSDRVPMAWHLAVSRNISKSRFKLPYPFVIPYYLDEKYLTVGMAREEINSVQMKIYDRERVICDCLRQKNKIDSEMFNKAVQAYVNDPKKNIKNLIAYSKELRAYKKALDLIGVWL